MLVVGNNEQFTLCRCSVPELATDERYREERAAVAPLPRAQRDHHPPLLLTRPAQHWIDALDPVGVPCGLINSMDEVFAHPQSARERCGGRFEGVANSPPTLANPLRFLRRRCDLRASRARRTH